MHLTRINGTLCLLAATVIDGGAETENIRLVDWIANLTRQNIAVVHKSTARISGPNWYRHDVNVDTLGSYRARVSRFVLCSLPAKLFARALKPVSSLLRRLPLIHTSFIGKISKANKWICMPTRKFDLFDWRNIYLYACVCSSGSFSASCIYLCYPSVSDLSPLISFDRIETWTSNANQMLRKKCRNCLFYFKAWNFFLLRIASHLSWWKLTRFFRIKWYKNTWVRDKRTCLFFQLKVVNSCNKHQHVNKL